MSNLQIVIPLAGLGSRFEKAKYTFPKPLVDVNGKAMIARVIENLKPENRQDVKFIFIVQKEHCKKYKLESVLKQAVGNYPMEVVKIKGVTQGAACTVLLAADFINNDDELMIANSDQLIESHNNYEMNLWYNAIPTEGVDGHVMVFKANHPMWSYARVDKDGFITEIAEKKVISEWATCVHYNTPVLLPSGKTELIGKLVNNKSEQEVVSYNKKTNVFENKKITGWVKKEDNVEDWYELSFVDSRNAGGAKGRIKRRVHITGDHKVFTNEGWKKVENLNGTEKIKTRYYIPNEKQLEFIDGTLLGDGMYRKPNAHGELGKYVIKQGKKQKEWFDTKYNLTSCFGGGYSEEPARVLKIMGRDCKVAGAYIWALSSNPYWSKQRKRWYKENKKIIPKDLKLTPLMIATWYMDDGSLGSSGERLILCTDCFTKEEVEFLQEQLKNNFNILSRIDNRNRIVISNGVRHKGHMSAFKFFDLIAPYIIPSMRYKIPSVYSDTFSWDNFNLKNPKILESDIIIKKINYSDIKSNHPHKYCLEIEDNHNFVAGDMIISNCGVYWFKHGKDFVKGAEQMIKKDIRTNNEFYVAPVYNELILADKKIIPIEVEPESMCGLGNPELLEKYLKN